MRKITTSKTKQKKQLTQTITKKEVERKIFHILFGTSILAMIILFGTKTSIIVLFACLVFGVILSILIKKGINFGIINKIVQTVERENEKNFPGKAAVYFFTAAIILLGIFPNNPTLILGALSVQVFADASAALIGMKYGKHKLYKKKTWEGSIACIIVAITCLTIFYPLPIAIIAGIIATTIEILPLDDNLFIPLITAAALMAMI